MMSANLNRKTALGLTTFCAAALLALAAPLAAETRHCNAKLVFTPQNSTQTWVSFDYSVFKTVDGVRYNGARAAASDRIIACTRAHWEGRDSDTRPEVCTNGGGFEFRGYPFENLMQDVTDELCAANPGVDVMRVTVEYEISGQKRCTLNIGQPDRRTIAESVAIDCRPPIGDGGADEAYEPPAPIGEGGGWECVGEGCDSGEPSASEAPGDEAPGGEGPPASASYALLPLIRLPGNDLYMLDSGDGVNDWLDCRQACTEDPNCRAFTYQGVARRCLIKSGAGLHVPALNHQSGIKR